MSESAAGQRVIDAAVRYVRAGDMLCGTDPAAYLERVCARDAAYDELMDAVDTYEDLVDMLRKTINTNPL